VIHDKIHKTLDNPALPGPNVPATATSAMTDSAVGSVLASNYLGPSTGHGSQILLRIRIAEYPDGAHVSTTIPMYVHHLCFVK
jgi:hypothetical protein